MIALLYINCIHSSSAYVVPVTVSLLADRGGPKAVMLALPALSVGIFSGAVGGGKEAFTKCEGRGLMRKKGTGHQQNSIL